MHIGPPACAANSHVSLVSAVNSHASLVSAVNSHVSLVSAVKYCASSTSAALRTEFAAQQESKQRSQN